ncbi:hypothetical protein ACRAWC_22585 [Leifsonia sp. L25]
MMSPLGGVGDRLTPLGVCSHASSVTPTLQACDSVSSIPFGWKHAVW